MNPDDRPGDPADPDPAAIGRTGQAGQPAPAGQTRRPRGRRGDATATQRGGNMLPGRDRRRLGLERFLVRLVATAGIIGIGVALGAILSSSKVQGWIIGAVVAGVAVILSAILWSSRQL